MGLDTHPVYVLAAGATFIALCTIVVALRFYTRYAQTVKYGVDDWLCIPALLMVIGCGIDLIVGVRLKVFGYPTPTPSGSQDPHDMMSFNFTVGQKLQWAFFLMQISSMGFVKLSFVFFFRRIFVVGKARSRFNVVSLIVAITTGLWCMAFFLWFLLSCRGHFAARWTTVKTLGTYCPTDDMSDLALAISDMITDVMVLSLPIPMVLRLNMKMSRKLAVLGIFALGTLALIASIVRLAIFVYATRVAEGLLKGASVDQDLLITQGLYWSMLESGLSLIACCLPTLSALVRRRVLSSWAHGIRSALSPRSNNSHSKLFNVEKSDAPTLGISDSMLKVSALEKSRHSEAPHADDPLVSKHEALNFEREALTDDSQTSLEGKVSPGKLSMV